MTASARTAKPTTPTERTLQHRSRRRVRRRGIALVLLGVLLGGLSATTRPRPSATSTGLVTPEAPAPSGAQPVAEPSPPLPWTGVVVAPRRGLVRFAVPLLAGAPRLGDRVEVLFGGDVAVAVAKVTVVGNAPSPFHGRIVVDAVACAGPGRRSLGGAAGRAVRVRPAADPRGTDEASGGSRERRDAPALAALHRR